APLPASRAPRPARAPRAPRRSRGRHRDKAPPRATPRRMRGAAADFSPRAPLASRPRRASRARPRTDLRPRRLPSPSCCAPRAPAAGEEQHVERGLDGVVVPEPRALLRVQDVVGEEGEPLAPVELADIEQVEGLLDRIEEVSRAAEPLVAPAKAQVAARRQVE